MGWGRFMESLMNNKRLAILEDNIARIPLGENAKDGYAIVDKELATIDAYKWSINGSGYPTSRKNGQKIFMHHFIMGKPVDGEEVDHINHIRTDNRKSNLRHVSVSANRHNSIRQKKQN